MAATTPRETLDRLVSDYRRKWAIVSERAAADLDRYASGLSALVAAAQWLDKADGLAAIEDADEQRLAFFCLGACCHEIEMAYNAEKTATAMVAAAQTRKRNSAKGGSNSRIKTEMTHEQQLELIGLLYETEKRNRHTDRGARTRVSAKLKAEHGIKMSPTTVGRRLEEREKCSNSDC